MKIKKLTLYQVLGQIFQAKRHTVSQIESFVFLVGNAHYSWTRFCVDSSALLISGETLHNSWTRIMLDSPALQSNGEKPSEKPYNLEQESTFFLFYQAVLRTHIILQKESTGNLSRLYAWPRGNATAQLFSEPKFWSIRFYYDSNLLLYAQVNISDSTFSVARLLLNQFWIFLFLCGHIIFSCLICCNNYL